MNKFSNKSRRNLDSCHSDLQKLFDEVIKYYDCSVICGYRGKSEQNNAYHEGRSTKIFPQSKHNSIPSLAVDVVPYPIDWNDKERFYYFGGLVKGIAETMDIHIRWGGDWDMDDDLHDQSFMDLPHFELD